MDKQRMLEQVERVIDDLYQEHSNRGNVYYRELYGQEAYARGRVEDNGQPK